MATLAFNLVSVCAGGDHAIVSVSLNGGPTENFVIDIDDFCSVTWGSDERKDFVERSLRLAVQGLTRVQARNKVNAGFAVTF